MTGIDADFVFFDLDDTLLDHRGAERAALTRLHAELPGASRHALEHFLETYRVVNADVWMAYGAGRITKHTAQALRFERLFERLGIVGTDPVRLGETYLERYGGHWAWLDGAEEAYRAAAGRVPVGIITNGFAEVQRAKLARFPELAERARVILISEEAGLMKPDPRLFDHAARLSGHAPHRLLYVGDSLHSDVEGALGAGWQAAWFGGDRSVAPSGTLVIDDWRHFRDVLGA